MTQKQKIAILGAGVFGTALAKVWSDSYDVSLWSNDEQSTASINDTHQHPSLAGIILPANISASTNLNTSVKDSTLVVSALPLIALREVWTQAAPLLSPQAYVLSVSKGVEENTLKLPGQILQQFLSKEASSRLGILSGPTFAQELALGLPTVATIAAAHEKTAEEIQKMISVDSFRAFVSTDMIGVEVGGALKNVIAIAVGICHGLKFGHNAQAALITRGIAEVARLAVAMGAQPATLAGLSGLGDLILTCSSTMSRNYRFGVAVAHGKDVQSALSTIGQTVEGLNTAKSARALSEKFSIDMPICESVYRILFEKSAPSKVLYGLMNSSLKHELD